ncbi:MAG: hypothetical protein Q8R55_02380 [Candidatus Taylorbacteria bacterium]|nr:hypothetical protein [Candidatus Taylorbacteria bacterium]
MPKFENDRVKFTEEEKESLKENAANEFISRLEFLIKEGVTLDILGADIAGHAKVSQFVADRALEYLNERFGNGSLKISCRSADTSFKIIIQDK